MLAALKMQRDAVVLLCCDVDPDREAFAVAGEAKTGGLEWSGLSRGVPRLLDVAAGLEKELGTPIHFNWFFRSDLQIEKICGDCAWPFKAWPDLIAKVSEHGDEIAWHPHLWRSADGGKTWFQETEDLDYLCTCLRRGFSSIPLSLRPSVVRMGWDFHNAFTMRLLSDLGLAADLSALPGLASEGALDRKTNKRIVVRDWAGAPDRPYFPSKDDPRRESKSLEDRLSILEIPVSTFVLPASMRLVKKAKARIKGHGPRSNVSEPYITRRPALFKVAIEHHLMNRDAARVPMVVEFHADELLPERGAHSFSNMIRNIELVVNSFRKAGLAARFERASDVAKKLKDELGG